MSDKRRRDLSDNERAEWSEFTRKIAPLSPRARIAASEKKPGEAAPEKPRARATLAPAKQSPKVTPREAPPLVPLERREKQRVARGKVEIEGRIDLHGHTQSEAHAALLRFVRSASASGKRMVLVITGKSGVLRQQAPLWLGLPELRPLVLGFETAAIKHGGDGALYVRLRRARPGD